MNCINKLKKIIFFCFINKSPNQKNIEIFNHKTFLNKNEKNIEEEGEEEEPQWANDNVEDFNNIKIKFRAIPK